MPAILGLVYMSMASVLSGLPVIVVETGVAQYRTASDAIRKELTTAIELDASDPQLGDKVAAAPLVVAVGRKSFDVVKPMTQQPLVFCMVLGITPEELGKNITGVPIAPDPGQVLTVIHALAPTAARVGYIHGTKTSDLLTVRAGHAAQDLGLKLVEREVATGAEAKAAFDGLVGSIDALYLPPDPKIFGQELLHYLLTEAAGRKIPLIGFLDSIAQAGALASVSPQYTEIGAQAGRLAAEILRRPEGRRIPAPPLLFAPGQISINLKTAKALGLVVPAAVQASAEQVFQ